MSKVSFLAPSSKRVTHSLPHRVENCPTRHNYKYKYQPSTMSKLARQLKFYAETYPKASTGLLIGGTALAFGKYLLLLLFIASDVKTILTINSFIRSCCSWIHRSSRCNCSQKTRSDEETAGRLHRGDTTIYSIGRCNTTRSTTSCNA